MKGKLVARSKSRRLLALSSDAFQEASDHFIQLLADNQDDKEATPILFAALKVHEKETTLLHQLVQDEKI